MRERESKKPGVQELVFGEARRNLVQECVSGAPRRDLVRECVSGAPRKNLTTPEVPVKRFGLSNDSGETAEEAPKKTEWSEGCTTA